MTPEQQARQDKAIIKLQVIRNGVVVRDYSGVYAFDVLEKAFEHIKVAVERIKEMQAGYFQEEEDGKRNP